MLLVLFATAVMLAAPADLPSASHLKPGLIVEASPAQQKLLVKHREGINSFLDSLLCPGDEGFLVTVDRSVKMVSRPTSSRQERDRALGAAMYGNPHGTTLADSCRNKRKCHSPAGEAVASVAKQFGNGGGGKVILVLGEVAAELIFTSAIPVFSVKFRNESPSISDSFDKILGQLGETCNFD